MSLNKRYYFETVIFLTPLAAYFIFLNRNIITRFLRWMQMSMCPFELTRQQYSYTCYIFCCDEDSDDVTNQLYNKMFDDDINAGIILNNCEINRPGRSSSEITADIITKSLSLIFFVTSSYLADGYCKNYHLIPVLENIKEGNIRHDKVLLIMVDDAVLPNDIELNNPSVYKVQWRTSKSHSAYNRVRDWLPLELVRFSEGSFMGGIALIKRGKYA
jgi:hypothetical protein